MPQQLHLFPLWGLYPSDLVSGEFFQKRIMNLGNLVVVVVRDAAVKELMACVNPHLTSKIISE